MNTSKYTALVLVLLMGAASLWAADVDQILARRSQAALLPNSDSVILYYSTIYTIHPDGRVDREEHLFRYLRNLNAWDEYGDPHIPYHSGRQELDVQVSRTHVPDGRKVDGTPNAFNPIVPFGLDRAPDFTDYRQMVVTHLGIEHDVVTELKYVIRDTEPFYPWAWGDVVFGDHEPIMERVVTVNAPRNAGLVYKSQNGAPAGVHGVSGDTESVTWTMKDLKSYDFADAADYRGKYLPRASFSTCANWDTFTAELESRFDAALTANGSFGEEITEMKGLADDLMKIEAVTEFIGDRIAVKNFPDLGMLLSFRSADQIYQTGYGSSADMAVLYASMLKELGFSPVVYLLGYSNMPVPGLNGHEIYSIYLEADPLNCRINPRSGVVHYLPPVGMDFFGVWPALAATGMPPTAYQKNTIKLDLEVTFAEDMTAEGWVVVNTTGQMSMIDVAVDEGATGVIEHLTEGLYVEPEIEDAVIQVQERDRVAARADLTFEAAEETVENLLVIELPWAVQDFHGMLPDGLELYQAQRDVPVMMGCAGIAEVNVTFICPESWTVELKPAAFSREIDGVGAQRVVTAEDHKVKISEKVTFMDHRYSETNWDAWRHLLMDLSDSGTRSLVFKTK